MFMLALSLVVFASDKPLKIINNTPFRFEYMMTTTYFGATEPIYAFPLYRMSSLLTLAPYSSVVYNDPSNPGLPFYMVPSTWDYFPVSWSSFTTVSGNTAYLYDGEKQIWASVKFNVVGASGFSGHIGPFQGSSYSAPWPQGQPPQHTLTWIPSGSGSVTIVLQ